MDVGRIFSRGSTVDCSSGSQKDFSRGTKVVKFYFHPLESKKTTTFSKTVIGKCQISKSWGALPPCPLSNTHVWMFDIHLIYFYLFFLVKVFFLLSFLLHFHFDYYLPTLLRSTWPNLPKAVFNLILEIPRINVSFSICFLCALSSSSIKICIRFVFWGKGVELANLTLGTCRVQFSSFP